MDTIILGIWLLFLLINIPGWIIVIRLDQRVQQELRASKEFYRLTMQSFF